MKNCNPPVRSQRVCSVCKSNNTQLYPRFITYFSSQKKTIPLNIDFWVDLLSSKFKLLISFTIQGTGQIKHICIGVYCANVISKQWEKSLQTTARHSSPIGTGSRGSVCDLTSHMRNQAASDLPQLLPHSAQHRNVNCYTIW